MPPARTESVVMTATLREFIALRAANLATAKVLPAPGAPTMMMGFLTGFCGRGRKLNRCSIEAMRACAGCSMPMTVAQEMI